MHGEDDQTCPFPTSGAKSVKLVKHGHAEVLPWLAARDADHACGQEVSYSGSRMFSCSDPLLRAAEGQCQQPDVQDRDQYRHEPRQDL
jgi:hypothetical protein